MSGYDPTGFLELADQLIEDGRYDKFGRSRTAIGRAYYAAFLMVKKNSNNWDLPLQMCAGYMSK